MPRLGVWVSQSRANFELYGATFHDNPERVTFGWLANRLPSYPDTLSLPTNVHWQPDGDRPKVEILPGHHPLYVDQSRGITMERAIAFAELALHPGTEGGSGRLPM